MTNELEMVTSEYLPLREVVYEALRKAILKEQLKPGERLMENTIAQRLGVSRTPVREAIRMLSDEGLAQILPRRGAMVARISEKELEDVLEVRQSLEALAMRKACERIDDESVDALEAAGENFMQMTRTGSISDMAEADVVFHDIIYQAAGNDRLMSILSNLREQMYRFRLAYLKVPGVFDILNAEHAAIVEAVRERDAERAITLIREHIDNQQKAVGFALAEEEKQ